MNRLRNSVAVVTGGAEGVGRAVCDLFAEEGAAVGIIDINGEAAATAANQIASESGAPAVAAYADVGNPDSVARAVDRIVASLGPPQVLVNNAAAFIVKGLEASYDDWRRCLDVNVIGVALVTREIVAHMRAEGGGSIVNIGSVSAFIAQKGFLTYNASKGAVVEMTRCLALDLIEDNIRVNGVCPGPVWSSHAQRVAAENGWSREFASQQPNFGPETILKRVADTREIAQAVLFLASSESSYITGENLMVDGGWLAV